MAQTPNIRRNLEAGNIFIALWVNGLHVNRSPLFTPLSSMGAQIISRYDTLWGGSNMELSMQNTLVRRPGYSKYCTSAFGSSEFPLAFYSYKNLSGSITTLVDTQTDTYTFSTIGKSSIVSKLANSVQTAFQRIGQSLYLACGKSFNATGDSGSVGTARPVGIAVPAVQPTFTVGTTGYLLPTTGFTYGYSYANSTSGHVSTMSPISANVGDLNVASVTEGSVTVSISLVTSVVAGDGPGTVTFNTPNGNNFSVGQSVVVSGFPVTTAGTWVVNNTYVITACNSGSFSASTAVWGPAYHGTSGQGFGQNCPFSRSTIGCYGTLSPITIPGTSGPGANYTYTVVNTANFSATNAFGAVTPSPVSVKSPGGATTYVQIASGTPAAGQFVVNISTGEFTFNSADTGKPIVIKYAITPTNGATPVSFTVKGPSSDNAFGTATVGVNNVGSNGQQTDTTGFPNVDSIVVYRDQDTDLSSGPWYYLAKIPCALAITQATVLSQSNQVVYTLANACPAGANNGFAGATNTKGATITGFVNAGNNGTFDIVASTTTTITCTNGGGVNETHAAKVNSDTWSYTDTGAVYGYPFNGTIPDGELDTLILAPVNAQNNPPPNTTNPVTTSVTGTFSLLCYGAGRMWGAVDNFVYFAGGPDVTFGNGNESWPPANVFTFPGKVTALASVPAGIVVFTADDFFIIYGTSTSTFYPQVYQKNFGVASQNCVVLDGDTLYIFSNTGQLYTFTNRLVEIGENVAPLLSSFAPASVYMTMHKSGYDVGLFISNGSTNYLRLRVDENGWSPMCQIVGGASCFSSIETTTGVYKLLVGAASGSGFIASRDLTTWQDIGGTYTCNAIVGSLIVAPPGASAVVEYISLQYMPVGTAPTISIYPQGFSDLTGTLTNFTALGSAVNDPPKLIEANSPTLHQKRWYLKSASSPVPLEMSNLQINIAFPSENFKNEVLTMGVT
jgi:hypothetical protein